ncbi:MULTISPECIES: hypothetical protein [unclassified Sphingomonas]|uniref:hypothetical protein n=1 Tax=unclassified Sphingomonas TaxID=196159 RepID=UPI0012E3EEA2|nr:MULTISPECIES: hypothetical protein [unclassified Sphingomonas]
MIRRWLIGLGGIVALFASLIGWGAWAGSGSAPYFVSSSFDGVWRIATGDDPTTRCYRRETHGGTPVLGSIGTRLCHELDAPKRFRGIFFDEFEGQLFIEGSPPGPPYREPQERVWPSFDGATTFDKGTKNTLIDDGSGSTRVFEIEFIGRKTSRKGRYGHFGMSQHEVVIDRVVRLRLLHKVEGYADSNLLIRRKY